MAILLIGLDGDLHLDSVLLQLERKGQEVVRINPERVSPENSRISWSPQSSESRADIYGQIFDLHRIQGIFCRYALEALRIDTSDAIERFVFDEFWTALRGALAGSFASCQWINDPFREAHADQKPLQIALAESVGLKTPSTIISQDKKEISAFASERPCIIKHLGDTGIVSFNGAFSNEMTQSSANEAFASFTAKFEPATLQSENADLSCPVFLQELIDKDFDLRVTVIDDQVFPARLSPSVGAHVDIRNNPDVGVSRFDLDQDNAKRLVSLVNRLGLRYASCDFVSRGGELIFLEANPSGNWLWTELGAGLPISEVIADALIGENTMPPA